MFICQLMKRTTLSFFFFFFRIHSTFQFLRFGKRKRFELYLSLTDFRSQTFSFYGWFILSSEFMGTATYFNAGPHKTKDSFSNFSNACRLLGAKIPPTNQNHLFFFHHLAESRHPTDLDLRRPSLQQARVQGDMIGYHFSPTTTTLTVGLSLLI